MAGRRGSGRTPRSERGPTPGSTFGRTPGPTPGSTADLTPAADPESVARAIALRQLTAGPRTRAQLADAMRRRNVPPDAAEAVLDRFTDVQLIDDEEFARQWVSTRRAGRGLARRALAHELRQRGVAEETVREAVADIDSDDEYATACALARRRLSSVRGDDPQRAARRLAGALARKGYSSGVALRAVREVLGEATDATEHDAAGEQPGDD